MAQPTAEETYRYESHFSALDTTGAGVLTFSQARPLFERAGLDDALINRLWARVASGGHHVDRGGFVTIMHLATLAMQGVPPPGDGADDTWALPDDAAAKYDGYFALLDVSGGGYVSRAQAEPLFDQAQLPGHEMSLIWSLADVDGDDRLNHAEFRVAMHLATLAVQGQPLPSRLPAVLEHSARGGAHGHTSAASSEMYGSGDAPAASSSTASDAYRGLPMEPHDLAHYRAVFLAAEPERGSGVDGRVGSRVLAQSGLPEPDLEQVRSRSRAPPPLEGGGGLKAGPLPTPAHAPIYASVPRSRLFPHTTAHTSVHTRRHRSHPPPLTHRGHLRSSRSGSSPTSTATAASASTSSSSPCTSSRAASRATRCRRACRPRCARRSHGSPLSMRPTAWRSGRRHGRAASSRAPSQTRRAAGR